MDEHNLRILKNSYSREAAIKEGRLIAVPYSSRKRLNPYPTFISVGLLNACLREHPRRRPPRRHSQTRVADLRPKQRIGQLTTLVTLLRWLEKGLHGEFTVYFDGPWLRYPLPLRVVVEPDEDRERIITILLEAERLDFGIPRPRNGGSFFVM